AERRDAGDDDGAAGQERPDLEDVGQRPESACVPRVPPGAASDASRRVSLLVHHAMPPRSLGRWKPTPWAVDRAGGYPSSRTGLVRDRGVRTGGAVVLDAAALAAVSVTPTESGCVVRQAFASALVRIRRPMPTPASGEVKVRRWA